MTHARDDPVARGRSPHREAERRDVELPHHPVPAHLSRRSGLRYQPAGGGRPDLGPAARHLSPAITTHAAGQVFYFGDGLLRHLDYTAGASGGAPAAHYTGGYQTFGRLAFPTRRRVYRRNPDGTPGRSLAAITLDIYDITVSPE
jgi:hypothetical protein